MGNEERLAYLEKLIKEHKDALQEVENNQGKKLKDYKEKIVKEGCFHPEMYQYTYKEECDDGYGRFWYVDITECTLCKEKKFKYNTRRW